MAVDAKAVATFGYLPTLTAQLYVRVITFGWLGQTYAPTPPSALDLIRGLTIRIKRAHKL